MLDQRREQFVFRFSPAWKETACLLDGYDDSSLYPPILRRVFSSRRRRPLLPVFLRKPAESMVRSLPRSQGRELGSTGVHSSNTVYLHACRSLFQWENGAARATLRGRTRHARTDARARAHVHIRTHTHAHGRKIRSGRC